MAMIKESKHESVVCDYCGCDKTIQITRQTDVIHKTTNEVFNIVQCANCGLHFTNPRPSSQNIGLYYSENYSFHNAPSTIKTIAKSVAEFVANNALLARLAGLLPGFAKKLVPFVKPFLEDPVRKYYVTGGKGGMLDIGCGAGSSTNIWGSRGGILSYQLITDVAGVEISSKARESLVAKGVEVYADIDTVPTSRMFGVIRMNWSLEHVHSPARYFQYIKDHLVEGGQAVIAVPNYEGLLYKLAPDCVELPIHLYHFRPSDIENYARRVGLQIHDLSTFSYPNMFHFAAQLGMFSKAFTTQFGLREARNFQSMLNRFDRAGWGNDMVVVLVHE